MTIDVSYLGDKVVYLGDQVVTEGSSLTPVSVESLSSLTIPVLSQEIYFQSYLRVTHVIAEDRVARIAAWNDNRAVRVPKEARTIRIRKFAR